jgi:hypothetical protein
MEHANRMSTLEMPASGLPSHIYIATCLVAHRALYSASVYATCPRSQVPVALAYNVLYTLSLLAGHFCGWLAWATMSCTWTLTPSCLMTHTSEALQHLTMQAPQ